MPEKEPLSRRKFTLALALTPGIGGKTLTRILTRNDLIGRPIPDFLKLGPEALREEYKLKPTIAHTWCDQKEQLIQEATNLTKTLAPFKIAVLTAADAHYPRRIEAMDSDPPGLLYLYGNHRLIERTTFSVLSSRRAPDRALQEMEHLAEEHILAGRVLVTGHDTPEYQRTAVTALRWGAPRILVLDTGLFSALGEDLKEEPFASARLWRYQFDPETDLALTFINPLRKYHRNANRTRDKLVASLSLQLDFVHINPGGNMEKLAHSAIKAGRPTRVSELSPTYESLTKSGATSVAPNILS